MEKLISILLLLSLFTLNSSCKSKPDRIADHIDPSAEVLSHPPTPPVVQPTGQAINAYPDPSLFSATAKAEQCSKYTASSWLDGLLSKLTNIERAVGDDADLCVAYFLENSEIPEEHLATTLRTAIVTKKNKSAKLLLSRGIQPKDSKNRTPLMLAINSKNLELFSFLIQKSTLGSINAQDKDGLTPLMFAAKKDLPSVVQGLLDKGANRNIQDNKGQIALDHAPAGSQARFLLERTRQQIIWE